MPSAICPVTHRFYLRRAIAAGCPEDQFRNFVRAGILLQDRQLAASAAARLCDHPDGPTAVGYGGARGGGKSHWLLAQMGADDCQRVPGLKCLLLRKVGKANLEHFEDLRRRLFGQLTHEFSAYRGILTFANGSKIIAGHFQSESDIDAYLGLEYDVIGVEEATTLSARKYSDISTCCRSSKPLPPSTINHLSSEVLLTKEDQLSTTYWRPRIYSTTNPGGVGHAWYRSKFILPHLESQRHCHRPSAICHPSHASHSSYSSLPSVPSTINHLSSEVLLTKEDPSSEVLLTKEDPSSEVLLTKEDQPSTIFIPARVSDNTFNNPEYKRVLENLHGWQRRAWLDGDWDIAAGQFFTTFRRDIHVIDHFDDTRAREWFAALDYGFTHYTVVLLGCTDADGNTYIVDEHAERLWLPQRHAAAVKAMLARHSVPVDGSWLMADGLKTSPPINHQPLTSTLNYQPPR